MSQEEKQIIRTLYDIYNDEKKDTKQRELALEYAKDLQGVRS